MTIRLTDREVYFWLSYALNIQGSRKIIEACKGMSPEIAQLLSTIPHNLKTDRMSALRLIIEPVRNELLRKSTGSQP